MASIRLDEEHGVNPALTKCFFCGGAGNLLLCGNKRKVYEAAHGKVVDMEPCGECKSLMKQGIFLIEVDESKSSDPQQPWRTGVQSVIKEEAFKRFPLDQELLEGILKARMTYVPIDAWDMLGLPREDIDNREKPNDGAE